MDDLYEFTLLRVEHYLQISLFALLKPPLNTTSHVVRESYDRGLEIVQQLLSEGWELNRTWEVRNDVGGRLEIYEEYVRKTRKIGFSVG